MIVLLDTHTLIWAGDAQHLLSSKVRNILADRDNEVCVSAATAWEIATKVRLGKLPEAANLEGDLITLAQRAGYQFLPIDASHALRAGRLAGVHRDPFDRMIAAQALAFDIPVLSNDRALDSFGVHRIW